MAALYLDFMSDKNGGKNPACRGGAGAVTGSSTIGVRLIR